MTLQKAEAAGAAEDLGVAVAAVVAAAEVGLVEAAADPVVVAGLGVAVPDPAAGVLDRVGPLEVVPDPAVAGTGRVAAVLDLAGPLEAVPDRVEAQSDRVEVELVREAVGWAARRALGAGAPVRETFQTLVAEIGRRSVLDQTLVPAIAPGLVGGLRKSVIDLELAGIVREAEISRGSAMAEIGRELPIGPIIPCPA